MGHNHYNTAIGHKSRCKLDGWFVVRGNHAWLSGATTITVVVDSGVSHQNTFSFLKSCCHGLFCFVCFVWPKEDKLSYRRHRHSIAARWDHFQSYLIETPDESYHDVSSVLPSVSERLGPLPLVPRTPLKQNRNNVL